MFASNELVDAVILHSSILVFEHISSEVVLMLANNVGTVSREIIHSTSKTNCDTLYRNQHYLNTAILCY